MSTISCISEENNIYKKGDITFQVFITLQDTRVYISKKDGSELLYIGRKEYEDIWWPRLKAHFPNLSSEMFYWEQDTYRRGYVVLYESTTPTPLHTTLDMLSYPPHE